MTTDSGTSSRVWTRTSRAIGGQLRQKAEVVAADAVPGIARPHDVASVGRHCGATLIVAEHGDDALGQSLGVVRVQLVVRGQDFAIEHGVEREGRAAGAEGLEQRRVGSADRMAVDVDPAV